ncbi:hypothetical protein [Nocardioides marmorisolisilvae]|uniref:hypothetical protein n=1 Tax=Nocardioides marmorisolisilvae TaxID=1542737 RepID=UPI0011CEC893|nr:hypothetical protein [Nocardioides marmorisolisilvae]
MTVTLEEVVSGGRTDIELTAPGARIIVEAKQGWLLPSEDQLRRYHPRFHGFDQQIFVTLSDASERWATTELPKQVEGTPVVHLSWDTVRSLVKTSQGSVAGRQRLWLDELEEYMGKTTSSVPFEDQWVFCVVVSNSPFGHRTFREYVTNERVYFHPYGTNGWPKIAPNFLCFRWNGVVQQVNRVASFEVVPTLTERWPSVAGEEGDGAHIVYELGPDIPIPSISTKGTFATGRVWSLLDQLLVSPTLAAAVSASKAAR